MKLVDLLSEDRIVLPLISTTKDGAIRELVEAFSKSARIEDSEALLRKVEEREKLKTTGVGNGVALPHAVFAGVNDVQMALGIAPDGLDFDAFDAGPVFLVFLIVTPGINTPYLTVLEHVAGIFLDNRPWKTILEAGTPAEALAAIEDLNDRG